MGGGGAGAKAGRKLRSRTSPVVPFFDSTPGFRAYLCSVFSVPHDALVLRISRPSSYRAHISVCQVHEDVVRATCARALVFCLKVGKVFVTHFQAGQR